MNSAELLKLCETSYKGYKDEKERNGILIGNEYYDPFSSGYMNGFYESQPSPLPESVEEAAVKGFNARLGTEKDGAYYFGFKDGSDWHQTNHSAEVERLREALQKIASHIQHGQLIRDAYAEAKRIAKDALKEK